MYSQKWLKASSGVAELYDFEVQKLKGSPVFEILWSPVLAYNKRPYRKVRTKLARLRKAYKNISTTERRSLGSADLELRGLN
jgi:hypothetical protein